MTDPRTAGTADRPKGSPALKLAVLGTVAVLDPRDGHRDLTRVVETLDGAAPTASADGDATTTALVGLAGEVRAARSALVDRS